MTKKTINDSRLRSIKAPYTDKGELADRDGLLIRITPKASISFYYRFSWQGKQVRFKISSYPEMSLGEARELVIKYSRIVQDGLDPRLAKIDGEKSSLLGDIATSFLKDYAELELTDNSIALYKSTINKYIKPYYNLDIERHPYIGWIKFFDEVRRKSSSSNAGSILKRIKTIARWSKSRGAIKGSEVLDIPLSAIGASHSKRHRVLDWNELIGLWRQVGLAKAAPRCRYCLYLLILTGARNSEIREARRDEFDIENATWTLPPERSKTNRMVRRPLSTGALKYIHELDMIHGKGREFLIEGESRLKPLTTHAVARFSKRMNKHLGYPEFVPHDFRRTISTRLSELKVMPHVTEKMLGHELGGIMAIYNKHDWFDEQAEAYELYWQTIQDKLNS